MRTWCLDFHASYRCRHSGECCRAPWEIAVEPRVVHAVDGQRIVALHSGVTPFGTDDAGAVILARTPQGDCHFHTASRCSLQVAGGEEMLPSACRHFPRVVLVDGRGCLLTLSHYCPTAAALLVDGGAISVVEARPPLALAGVPEGLDAREALPPLLRPGMLMDLESYARFESACLETFAHARSVEDGLATIAAAVEDIRTWRPGSEPLRQRIEDAFTASAPGGPRPALSAGYRLALSLTGPHPSIAAPPDLDSAWPLAAERAGAGFQQLAARYMAAVTFGNWMPYRGQGLRTVVEWLRACYDIFRIQIVREVRAGDGLTRSALIQAVRAADFLVVHTVDSLAFGRAAAACEQPLPA